MTAKTFAIGADGKVSLWCSPLGAVRKDGSRKFCVINGGWEGSIKDDAVRVGRQTNTFAGSVIWEGEAPFSHERYNEAIAWIEDQIRRPNDDH